MLLGSLELSCSFNEMNNLKMTSIAKRCYAMEGSMTVPVTQFSSAFSIHDLKCGINATDLDLNRVTEQVFYKCRSAMSRV